MEAPELDDWIHTNSSDSIFIAAVPSEPGLQTKLEFDYFALGEEEFEAVYFYN